MIKIAFFVEGQTEKVFIERFLGEYFNQNNIELEFQKYWGYRGVELTGKRRNLNAKYYVLIFDVGGDGSVASAVKERARGMIEDKGYQYVIALRDLFRNDRSEKRAVIEAFHGLFEDYLFRDKLKLVLAVMEIEAWFLADHTLFSRISPSISVALIRDHLGIDLEHDNSESYDHPAAIVSEIYQLFGSTYRKRLADSYRIVFKIDFGYLCLNTTVLEKISSWRYFLEIVSNCFST